MGVIRPPGSLLLPSTLPYPTQPFKLAKFDPNKNGYPE